MPSDHMYIIKSGQFEMTRTLRSVGKLQVQDFDTNEGIYNQKRNTVHKIMPKISQGIVIKLSHLCSGHIFGEEDIINERNYTTTVKCISSTGVIYVLSNEHFYENFQKNY
jgi:CRP-like cAMP-binding protein